MTDSPSSVLPAATSDDEIDLGQLAAALRRRWPVLLGGVLVS